MKRGDRVALVLPQRFETATAYIAINQLGAVATPLSMLFGPEALEYRLKDSGAVLALVECEALAAVRRQRVEELVDAHFGAMRVPAHVDEEVTKE